MSDQPAILTSTPRRTTLNVVLGLREGSGSAYVSPSTTPGDLLLTLEAVDGTHAVTVVMTQQMAYTVARRLIESLPAETLNDRARVYNGQEVSV